MRPLISPPDAATQELAAERLTEIVKHYSAPGCNSLELARQTARRQPSMLACEQWNRVIQNFPIILNAVLTHAHIYEHPTGKPIHTSIFDPRDVETVPELPEGVNQRFLFISFNRSVDYPRPQAPSEAFDRECGTLPLKAIAVYGGKTDQGTPYAEISLVLPRRSFSGFAHLPEYCVVTLTLDRFLRATIFRPNADISIEEHFLSNVGLWAKEHAVFLRRGCRDPEPCPLLDEALGFPEAQNYLINSIPYLAPHLWNLSLSLGDHAERFEQDPSVVIREGRSVVIR
jgi:hypothetical protein